jgi:hypothetical protein
VLAIGGVHVLLVVAADDVRVLQRLPQPRLQGACALERRRHAQLLGIHLRELGRSSLKHFEKARRRVAACILGLVRSAHVYGLVFGIRQLDQCCISRRMLRQEMGSHATG